jgi:formate/nitrite transporter FocA (FNT family)
MPESNENDESKASRGLSESEVDRVGERQSGSAKVVHEVIRLQGDEELDRPLMSLLFSGFAAGLAISVSVLAMAFLKMALPDRPWAMLIAGFGYSIGFVIVILGNLQLFTENTITAVLPLATHPTRRNLGRLARMWSAVCLANLAGTLLVAVMCANRLIVSPEQLAAMLALSAHALSHDGWTVFLLGIPAGFLVASIAWVLPNARGSEFWVVVVITYVIAIGEFSHVIAGSCEAWLMWLAGRASLGEALFGFIVPALLGNIAGGSCLFAVIAHGQVRDEINDEDQ